MKLSLCDVQLFRVRSSWDDIKSQSGAFFIFENAVEAAKKSKQNIYDNSKRCVWNYKEEN
ncbi:MAG: hypothetical protein IJD00_01510 [Clostridia bacterium]|nr:hypothetical protein [Clostridia bacterium]